ncbi:MAG: preprotein translocase subunit YajC [Pseudomonadota bacterium]
MFSSPAYAQAAGGAPGFDPSFLVMMALLLGIMWFFMIRPQQKKMKEHQAMVSALRKGDQVITAGGLIGKVAKVKDNNEIEIDLADGVRVRVVQNTITTVLNKTEPTS